ncbi:MAG TPA: hypothetical protein P5031_08195 [Candidatus Syntrophosphaera sp.]|mgnify:CR=1 FL=1|nr:hypothetical protein [Candidatus Syntrophosphaera sp.]
MADRSATAAVITELGATKSQPVHLVEITIDDADGNSTILYITDAWTSVTWNGHTYTALGHFMAFTDIEETAEVQVNALTLSLSGVDQSYISAFLSYYYIDRPVKIYKAFLDSTTMAVIADPILIFDGRMDEPGIEEHPEDGSCVVTVSATNIWVDFERKSGRHTNNEEQQVFFPGDLGFQYASEIVTDIIWGRK